VPISIKECFDWKGTPSTYGHPERRTHVAQDHATAVDRLTAAGAIVLGKTNVPKDLADWQSFNALYGRTNNPWDLQRSPGGSSGGSACALAAGLSALELGSDIGGSIRIPAHFCGVYGHKPTFGLVPFRGHSLMPSAAPDDLSVIGPLARAPEDLAIALRLLAGPDGSGARAWTLTLPEPGADRKSLAGTRIAVISDDAHFPVDREVSRAASNVAACLQANGAIVTLDPRLPVESHEAYALYIALLRGATTGRRTQGEIETLARRAAGLDPTDAGYEALMLRGLTQTHHQWLASNHQRARLRELWESFFHHYDALICPVSATPAFHHMESTPKEAQFLNVNGKPRPNSDTYFWLGLASVAYLPATTFPAGQSTGGLPIGLQIIGPEYGDLGCIDLAKHLETALGGFHPPPDYL
jgi:amidase